MSYVHSSGHAGHGTLAFLEKHPVLSDSLFADCNYDLQKVVTILEPVLAAKSRCQLAPFYIQAITTGQTTFITTNLTPSQQEVKVSPAASSWLIGRSSSCAIAILEPTVSRCHAVLGHNGASEFYLMDMGSSNGTRLNRRRLPQLERHKLRDGDLIEIGFVQVEFFASGAPLSDAPVTAALQDDDITYY